MSRQRCLDSFHLRVLIVKTVARCVALHGSRRLKRYRRRARTNRTKNRRGEGRPLSRQRGITFNTKFVSMSKSHVARGWLSPPFTSCPRREHARGHCVGMGIRHTWERGGTAHLGCQCSHQDLVTRRPGLWACEDGKRRAWCFKDEKNMRIVGLKGLSVCLIPAGWGCSWRTARKARTSQTFRGSGCRGGPGGRLLHICMWQCKQVSEFIKYPSRQCSASRVLEYLLRFHSLPPKRVPVFQVPPVVKNIGHVKRKFHEVIGGMRCGPARR